ncbi:MAG TPA: mechanosensitive ion channel family protein [Bacillota bacterium]|nr:mechanosensitive ion channel family protein [Bacillota bacterium]
MSQQLQAFLDYLKGPQLWATIGSSALSIVFILIIAFFVIRIGKNLINRFFSVNSKRKVHLSERRVNTLIRLVQSVLTYVVWFIAIVMILQSGFGLEIGPLIAGAGVVGLAIGFGAQNLVRDILSGFFIIFEDQFAVGDYVFASDVEGTVEEIGIRTTKILAWTGEMNVIPNGNITQVTNYSVSNGLAVVDINIPYEADIVHAEDVIEHIISDLPDKYEEIVTTPVIHGVQSLDTSHFVIRVIADTLPVYQWFGARAIRKEIKEHLYNEGIDIPSPRLVMYSRNEGNKRIVEGGSEG